MERNAFPFHGNLKNKHIVVHEALASDVAANIEEAVSDYALALENVDLDFFSPLETGLALFNKNMVQLIARNKE